MTDFCCIYFKLCKSLSENSLFGAYIYIYIYIYIYMPKQEYENLAKNNIRMEGITTIKIAFMAKLTKTL